MSDRRRQVQRRRSGKEQLAYIEFSQHAGQLNLLAKKLEEAKKIADRLPTHTPVLEQSVGILKRQLKSQGLTIKLVNKLIAEDIDVKYKPKEVPSDSSGDQEEGTKEVHEGGEDSLTAEDDTGRDGSQERDQVGEDQTGS